MENVKSEHYNGRPPRTGDFRKIFSVINNTGRVVYLYGREGYVAYIEPSFYRDIPNGIYFTTTLTNRGALKTEVSSSFNEIINEQRTSINDVLKSENVRYLREEHLTSSRFQICYVVQHDIALSFEIPEEGAAHPFSEQGIVNSICRDVGLDISDKKLSLSMVIIDNEGTFGDRFINIGGRAFKIPVIKDNNTTSGIYIGRTNEVTVNGQLLPMENEHYTFDRVEKDDFPFRLFTNPEDARTDDPSAKLKIALAEKKLELEKLKSESEGTSLALKEKYEQRAMERKDSSEYWKVVPTLFIAFVSIAKLLF